MYTTLQIKQMEELIYQQKKIPPFMLMKSAGESAFALQQQLYPEAAKIAIICGAGNNAGDGYVFATAAKKAGKKVICLYLNDPEQLKEPAATAAETAAAAGVSIQALNFENKLQDYDLIVDALLGTGFKGKLKRNFISAITAINQSGKKIISLDVPSGLNANTGHVAEIAVHATTTITFIAMKSGLSTADAKDYCGEIKLADLNISEKILNEFKPFANLLDYSKLKQEFLGPRIQNSHKGFYGHVAVIGGDYGMSGAIRMASEASARIGAGLTSAYTRAEHVPVITIARPEVMAHALTYPKQLSKLLKKATVIALGPGLGRDTWGQNCFTAVMKLDRVKIIDADALWFLANQPLKSKNWILTPHPKEAAMLLHKSTEEIQADRFAAVKQLQKHYGGTIVLKGAGTLIYDGKQSVQINPTGNPGMATGGMGDVLTGLIAGLVAQGIPLLEAACLGVSIHSQAADRCTLVHGERGLLALDLMTHIQSLVNRSIVV